MVHDQNNSFSGERRGQLLCHPINLGHSNFCPEAYFMSNITLLLVSGNDTPAISKCMWPFTFA